ncbi:MAG: hypothetical protein ABFC89_12875 [Methanospirillum sp.]
MTVRTLLPLLLVLVLVGPAAAGVVLSSPVQEVAVPAGEGGALAVVVENTYPGAVTGTRVRISTVDPGDGSAPETTVQSALLTLPTGSRQTRIALPPARAGSTERVDLRFEYTDAGTDRAAVLPGILVRFENGTPTAPADRPITSTDAPGPHVVETGGAPQGPITVDEALQRAQATAAPSGTPGVAPTAAMTPSPAVLRQINETPLLLGANRTLTAAGFAPASSSVVPVSPETVHLSAGYARPDGRTASLEAVVGEAGPAYVRTTADAYLALPLLDENATVRALLAEAAVAGLPCTGTEANTTPDNTTFVSIAFADQERNRASIEAVVRNGTISSIVVGHPPSPFAGLLAVAAGFALPVGAALLLCAALVGIVSRLSRRRPAPAPAVPVPERDRRAEAAALIAQADARHAAGDDREACRLLARAHRTLLSVEHDLAIEATDPEVLAHLAWRGVPPAETARTLDRCSRIAFGGAVVSADDYAAVRRAVAPVPEA